MLNRARLLSISKQSIADLVVGLNSDEIKATDSPKDLGLDDRDVPRINDSLFVRVRNGLTPTEQARFVESDFRDQLQFDSTASVSRITDDSQRGQSAALA
jgi:hypothetical protein